MRLPNQQVNKVVLAVEQGVGEVKSLERLAHCKHPPSLISPSSRNGLNRVIFDSLGRSAFF